MQVGSRSETGHVRQRNEDALLVDPDSGVFAVADGMGGHPAGDVASAIAVARLEDALRGYDGSDPETALVRALEEAHGAVVADAEGNPGRRGMGSTAVVAIVGDDAAWVAHVGDSRCYLLSGANGLRRVTEDHGAGGYLTQALGLDRGVRPDVATVPLAAGDRLLLCTDGLSNMVEDDEIATMLREADDAQAASDVLTAAALDAGGIDNVTTVVIAR
jgi:serine/threonine protein phosphatase PrpC